MITRERLEELIKQSATIYYIDCEDVEEMKLTKDNNPEIKKDQEYNIEYLEFGNRISYLTVMICPLITLYETKEEAEFALRYQNITRTETLSLPTWEEFEQKSYFNFIALDGRNIIIEQTLIVDFAEEDCLSDFNLVVSDWNDYTHKSLFRGDYTKESYTKACELCRKLFLGEEV